MLTCVSIVSVFSCRVDTPVWQSHQLNFWPLRLDASGKHGYVVIRVDALIFKTFRHFSVVFLDYLFFVCRNLRPSVIWTFAFCLSRRSFFVYMNPCLNFIRNAVLCLSWHLSFVYTFVVCSYGLLLIVDLDLRPWIDRNLHPLFNRYLSFVYIFIWPRVYRCLCLVYLDIRRMTIWIFVSLLYRS